MTTPTPADVAQRHKGSIFNSAHTRATIEDLIRALTESMLSDEEGMDMDDVVILNHLIRSTAQLTSAQADLTRALTERHDAIARRNA